MSAALDPEAFSQCPYDPNHKMRNKRIQIHLINCRKNNPAAMKYMQKCPFNAKHIVPKVELNFHKMSCPDRAAVDREILYDTMRIEKDILIQSRLVPIINHNIQSDENWDSDDFEPLAPSSYGSNTAAATAAAAAAAADAADARQPFQNQKLAATTACRINGYLPPPIDQPILVSATQSIPASSSDPLAVLPSAAGRGVPLVVPTSAPPGFSFPTPVQVAAGRGAVPPAGRGISPSGDCGKVLGLNGVAWHGRNGVILHGDNRIQPAMSMVVQSAGRSAGRGMPPSLPSAGRPGGFMIPVGRGSVTAPPSLAGSVGHRALAPQYAASRQLIMSAGVGRGQGILAPPPGPPAPPAGLQAPPPRQLATGSVSFTVDILAGRPSIDSEMSCPSLPQSDAVSASASSTSLATSLSTTASFVSAVSQVMSVGQASSVNAQVTPTAAAATAAAESAADVEKREERKLRKKLKEILRLEEESQQGKQLDADQRRKISVKAEVESQLLKLRSKCDA